MRFRLSGGAWLAVCLPLSASAAPVVEAPIPSIVGVQAVSGAAGEAGPAGDGLLDAEGYRALLAK